MASFGGLASKDGHTLSVDIDIDVLRIDLLKSQLNRLSATALIDGPDECRGKSISNPFDRESLVLSSIAPQL